MRELVVFAEAVQNVRPHKHTLHPHVQINAHLVVIVRTIVLDGVRVQGHQGLQEVVGRVLLHLINLPLNLQYLVEKFLGELELLNIDSKIPIITIILLVLFLSRPGQRRLAKHCDRYGVLTYDN